MFHLIIVTLALLSPPCASEGDTNCYWDASTQGNGQGRSFVDVQGTAYYLAPPESFIEEYGDRDPVRQTHTGHSYGTLGG